MTKTLWSSDSADIAKAIADHPELPVYFNIPNDELACDYSTTLHERHRVEVCTLWTYGDRSFWDEWDLKEQLEDDVYDETGLKEDELGFEVRSRFKDIPSQDCILVYTSA